MDGRSSSKPRRRYRHLPEGRQPGPQTRRRGTGEAIGIGVGAIVGGGCLAVVYLPILVTTLYLVGYSAVNPSEVAGAGWAILAGSIALTAGIPYAGWKAYRRFLRPQRSEHLQLEVSPAEAARGSELEARLTVSDVDRLAEQAQVGLVCTVFYDRWVTHHDSHGHTSRSRGTADEIAFEDWRPVQRILGTQRFTFAIPADAPFSHEGDCLSFAWTVAAREPVAMGRDPRQDEPIWVTP